MLIDNAERARRLASAIVSDIALYNQDLIKKGIQEDSLFELLEEDIAKGRQLYQSRVAPEVLQTSNFFNRALVDILIRKYGNVESKIW
jgi:hypothetical protein